MNRVDSGDRLLMMFISASGKTLGHQFIHECAARPLITLKYCPQATLKNWVTECKIRIGKPCRVFIPMANKEARILMFGDKSGVYIHPTDSMVTFLSKDITEEVLNYQEILE